MLTLFTVISIYTSYLLAALHEKGGRRRNTYRELGEAVFGGWWVGGCYVGVILWWVVDDAM